MTKKIIECKGHWVDTLSDGSYFDCDYPYPPFCGDCIVNDGKIDPRQEWEDNEILDLGLREIIYVRGRGQIAIVSDEYPSMFYIGDIVKINNKRYRVTSIEYAIGANGPKKGVGLVVRAMENIE